MPLQGLALTPETWENDVLPRRLGGWSPTWLDQLCSGGEVVWIGAGALGRSSGRGGALLPRGRALARPAHEPRRAAGRRPRTTRSASGSATGAAFWSDLLVDLGEIETAELQEALWDLVWAGEVTNDAWAPLRAPRLTVARDQAAAARAPVREAPPARRARRCRAAGR